MSTNLDLDALQHLADALTEDIVNTPGGMLLAEVQEDFGSTHALADEFDKTFDNAAQQATKERLEARAVQDFLDRLAEFRIEDILSASGDQLLDEVAEDHGDLHALAAEFDSIVRPIMSSHSNRSIHQSYSIATTNERSAASVIEWLRSLWQKSLTLLVDIVFPTRVAMGAISLACLLLIAVFAVRPMSPGRDDVIAVRPSAHVRDSATLTPKDDYDPALAKAANDVGNAEYAKGDLDSAIAKYDLAIKLDPNYSVAYSNRGNAFRSKGDFDEAIADYDQAIRLDPKYADAYNNRGEAYLKKGDTDHAIADFDRAIELHRGVIEFQNRRQLAANPSPNDAIARQLYVLRRKIRDFDEVLRLRPKDPETLNNRCWARAILGDLQAALRDCNEALQIKPRYADAFDGRGFVNLKSGQSSSAIADYDAALRINPKQASSLYGRGIAKLKAGNSADAMRDIAAAKALQPNIAEQFATFGIR
jgi:tetratricopeptide (TPR) repeat protein